MAEIKNSFIGSKMNKDIDDRLVPNSEYRDALNISVGKLDEGNQGSIQNSLGNQIVDFGGIETAVGLQSIGSFADNQNNIMYIFLTNYTDTSPTLDQPASDVFTMKIVARDFSKGTYTTLVSGAFLNFALNKEFRINSINLVEDLLFWTDNRNQPRKINVASATTRPATSVNPPPYYTKAHQISVAKYAPIEPILLYKKVVAPIVQKISSTEFTVLKTFSISAGMTIVSETTGGIPIITGGEYIIVTKVESYNTTLNKVTVYSAPSSLTAFDTGKILYFLKSTMSNESSNPSWPGDPEYMKDRYIRFSYRFKFDDNEYSLIAPFTQIVYVPLQKGLFINGDENDAYKSTVVKWMRNNINNVELLVQLPDLISKVNESYKITDIDILYKESDSLAVRVLDTVDIATMQLSSLNNTYTYSYQSRKPYRTLPQAEISRVYDKVPVRAFSQEVSGNRVIYGNYVDKHTPPADLNYIVGVGKKNDTTTNFIEYPNHTLKQKRNYQVGFVLADKYGRASSVILSSVSDTIGNSGSTALGGSTVFSDYPDTASPIAVREWFGNNLLLQLDSTISSTKNIITGEPGLYAIVLGAGFTLVNASTTSISNTTYTFTYSAGTVPIVGSYLRGAYTDYVKVLTVTFVGSIYTVTTEGRISDLYLKNNNTIDTKYAYTLNELGWYSYKVVVRQKEQEYYNVYLPGMLNGYPIGQTYGSQVNYIDASDAYSQVLAASWTSGNRDINLTSGGSTSLMKAGDFISGLLPGATATVFRIVNSTSFTIAETPSTTASGQSITVFRAPGAQTSVLENGINTTMFPLYETDTVANIVLLNDNINKVPRDLVEVGPDQKQYRSSAELWGRVQNSNNFAPIANYTVAQGSVNLTNYFYYDPAANGNSSLPDKLRAGYMMRLFTDVARTTPDTNIPDVKIISLRKDVGTGRWLVEFSPAIAPNPAIPLSSSFYWSAAIPSNIQYYPSAKPDIVSSISLALESNFLETSAENPLGSATTNIYQLQSNPSIGRVNTLNPIGITGDLMVPFLSVYETKPFESSLDIFWETSTIGYISDINDDVLSGFDGPVALNTFLFEFNEDQIPTSTSSNITGNKFSKYISNKFWPLDATETKMLANECPQTGFTVSDLDGNPRNANEFGIEYISADDTYRLYVINPNIFYNNNANTAQSYIFTVTFTFGGIGYPFTITGNLDNIAPVIDNTITQYSITQQDTVIATFTGSNGSYNSGVVNTGGLHWGITGNYTPGDFSIDQYSGILTLDNPNIDGNVYDIQVTLTDAWNFATGEASLGSLSDTIDITIDIGYQKTGLVPVGGDGLGVDGVVTDFGNTTTGLRNFNGQATNCRINGTGASNAFPYKYGVVYIGPENASTTVLPSYPLPTSGTSNVYQYKAGLPDLVGVGYGYGFTQRGTAGSLTQGGLLFTLKLQAGYACNPTTYSASIGQTQEAKLDLIIYRKDISGNWQPSTDSTNTFTSSFSDGVNGELYVKGLGQTDIVPGGIYVYNDVNRAIQFEIRTPGEYAIVVRLWDKTPGANTCLPGAVPSMKIQDTFTGYSYDVTTYPDNDNGSSYENYTFYDKLRVSNFDTRLWKPNFPASTRYGSPVSIPFTTRAVQSYPYTVASYTVIANPQGYSGNGYVNLSLPVNTALSKQMLPGLSLYLPAGDTGQIIRQVNFDLSHPGLIQTNNSGNTNTPSAFAIGSVITFVFNPILAPTSVSNGFLIGGVGGLPTNINDLYFPQQFDDYYCTVFSYLPHYVTSSSTYYIASSALMSKLTVYPTYNMKLDQYGNILAPSSGNKVVTGRAVWPNGSSEPALTYHNLNVYQNASIATAGGGF